ncbi:CTB family bacteriocin [Fortiea sp. LEGE XX443]|uniref:CTB family bacteriocin n=1 Tax=Fortiea sp. LEGE XX443 TaxID=1828611 RepID=UPI0018812E42|nr:CTB family bacteriocin [Fortiea sp. LEGE XX443]MBE9003663.1 CTB family bacteriocin [Fortiea sp. LEGE XX443]
MSHQIFVSELLIELSEQQQELVAGSADFELAGSNFAKRGALLKGLTLSGPTGSTGYSVGKTSAVNTAAQDFLTLGAPSVPTIGALGAAPTLNGISEAPVDATGGTESTPGGGSLPGMQ